MRQHAEKALASEHEGTGAGALLREHGALLARVAMALLGEQAAVERALEQVAKDAAHGKAPGDATTSATRAWLLGLVRTACAAQSLRAPRGTLRLERDAAPETQRDGDPGAARRSLARLKPTEREAVVLHLVGGLDARGIALACGVAEDVARARIASAVGQLIEEDGR